MTHQDINTAEEDTSRILAIMKYYHEMSKRRRPARTSPLGVGGIFSICLQWIGGQCLGELNSTTMTKRLVLYDLQVWQQ